jgi:hypothetical protein
MIPTDIQKIIDGVDDHNEVNESLFVELEQEFEQDIESLISGINQLPLDSFSTLQYYNIIIFGPTGAGKSSLVKTLFNAFKNEYLEPKDISNELIIKSKKGNEGTTKYSIFTLKEYISHVMMIQGRKAVRKNAGIRLMDTRGQIYLDQREFAHMDLMISVGL